METTSLQNIEIITLLIVIVESVALLLLGLRFWKLEKIYRKIIEKTDKKDLLSILEDIGNQQRNLEEKAKKNQQAISKLQNESKNYLQRIGFTRFNPFDDTGGQQSFSLSILDQEQNGLIITSLHSRELTRLYAKKIRNGQADTSELSIEEKRVLARSESFRDNG